MERTGTLRITAGVIIICILIVLDILLQHGNTAVPDGLRYVLRMIIIFAGVLATSLAYRKQSGSNLTFGDAFAHGFKTTAVITFLMALYTFIAVKFIYAAPTPAEMEAAVKAIEQQGNALHEEAKQLAVKAAANRWIVYVSLSIFVSLVPGALAALAGAALTKKNQ